MTTVLLAFWESVAVGVVSGLIVLAIGGLVAWAIRQRSRRQREKALRREQRAPLRAGLSAVASELRDCAQIVQTWEESEGRVLDPAPPPVSAWRNRRNEMTPLRDEDRALWDDLEQTYDALQTSKGRNDYSPSSAALLALAERLEKTLEREEKPARHNPTRPRKGLIFCTAAVVAGRTSTWGLGRSAPGTP
jgi:hypothetical protein